LYAANAASVTEYAAGAHGNVSPVRSISGAATSLVRGAAVGVSISGRAVVLDASRAVDIYAAAANGNVAPVQRITGSSTGLTGSSGLAIFEPLQIVGVNLFGTSAFTDAHYGMVHGYINGTTATVSQIVHITAGDPVVFKNVDLGYGASHTGSFLGNATATSASYPSSFNGSGTMSSAGTAIGTLHFSTGTLNAGQASAMYFAAPGFYILGCAFHYNLYGMRTVVVAQ
jgi:plastocyanin